jgi:two-component system, OmpR family, KDP operon response regulator KdpE
LTSGTLSYILSENIILSLQRIPRKSIMSYTKHQILFVNDELELLTLIPPLLEAEGYSVLKTSSGKDALDLFWQNDISLILLDMILPDMEGLVFLKNLRIDSQVPIIALSARDSHEDLASVLYTGADDYITKPFSYTELLARIASVLRRVSSSYLQAEKNTFQYQDLKINFQWQVVFIKGIKIVTIQHKAIKK